MLRSGRMQLAGQVADMPMLQSWVPHAMAHVRQPVACHARTGSRSNTPSTPPVTQQQQQEEQQPRQPQQQPWKQQQPQSQPQASSTDSTGTNSSQGSSSQQPWQQQQRQRLAPGREPAQAPARDRMLDQASYRNDRRPDQASYRNDRRPDQAAAQDGSGPGQPWYLDVRGNPPASRNSLPGQPAFGEGRPPRPRREKREKSATVRTTALQEMQRRQGCCYGCGAKLQVTVPLGPGYVPQAKFELKEKFKQLHQVLCERCSELCNGAMIPAVEDFTQKLQAQALLESDAGNAAGLELLGKALVTPDQLRKQLMEVSAKKAVVVLLVDLTDASGTLMAKIRDMVGKNPIVLVGTKLDLLPEGAHPKGVADWLQEAAARKFLNVVSCHLVSSHNSDGVSAATSKICRERKGRDVYVVGAANVGKSAFVRAMLKDMAKFDGGNFDPAAMANGRYLPVESPMPGTTLGIIPLRAFESGGTLFDTPGVHLHHRVPHMLSPSELKLLHPRKRLQPIIPLTPRELTEQQPDVQRQQNTDPLQQNQQQEEQGQQVQRPPRAQSQQLDVQAWDPAVPGVFTEGGAKRREGPSRGATAPAGPSSVRGSYSWSDLVRVDVLSAPPSTALAFYGPSTLRVTPTPLSLDPSSPDSNPNLTLNTKASASASASLDADANVAKAGLKGDAGGGVKAERGAVLECGASVAARGGLVPHLLDIRVDGSRGPLADVAISGVPGWVSVWAPGGKRDIRMRVWVPRGVEVFLRPPLPCASPFKADSLGQDAPLDIGEVSLEGLAAEYEGGSNATGINDVAWWEAAMQEFQAFEEDESEDGAKDGNGLEEQDDEEEEGAVQVSRPRRAGLGRRLGGAGGSGSGKERIIMQATVEDILKRPRFDNAFAELDFAEGEEDDGDGEEEAGRGSAEMRNNGGMRKRESGSSGRQQDGKVGEEGGAVRATVGLRRRKQPVKVGLRGSRGLKKMGISQEELDDAVHIE